MASRVVDFFPEIASELGLSDTIFQIFREDFLKHPFVKKSLETELSEEEARFLVDMFRNYCLKKRREAGQEAPVKDPSEGDALVTVEHRDDPDTSEESSNLNMKDLSEDKLAEALIDNRTIKGKRYPS